MESCIAQAHSLREVYDEAGMYLYQAYEKTLLKLRDNGSYRSGFRGTLRRPIGQTLVLLVSIARSDGQMHCMPHRRILALIRGFRWP